MDVASLLRDKKVLVCTGSGGVGKTTVSAALALRAAIEGRKVLVCTIDPAKRLADSMGLSELGNSETRIPESAYKQAGIKPKGELWGMMLDSKRTFDDLIERIAPTAEARDRILANDYYQNITTALAGSQEFAAMEKLYELTREKDYDLIVLDTPPTKHALDFLDAPNKMTSFLDGRVIQWFVKPYLMAGKMGFKFMNRSARVLFRFLEKATGYETMQELADFFLAFEGMYDGFKVRAQKVRDLMAEDVTAFVLVTSPQAPSLAEARYFLDRLTKERMPLGRVVFNRVHVRPCPMSPEEIETIGEKAMISLNKYAPVVDALCDNLAGFVRLAEADDTAIRNFLASAGKNIADSRIPFLDEDVHDLAGLDRVSRFI